MRYIALRDGLWYNVATGRTVQPQVGKDVVLVNLCDTGWEHPVYWPTKVTYHVDKWGVVYVIRG